MNYLWEGVLQSLFVLQYARRYHDRSYKIPAAGAALLGLLAGWSTETGAGAALMLSAMELYFSKTHKESGDWMTAGFAGLIAGFLLLVLPAIVPAPVYSFLAGDRSIDLINCVGMGCEESYDPYNEATAAYHGTGAFRVDYDADRPYEDKSLKVVINQLVQPVKSVIRRVSDMIQGIDTA